MWNSEGVGDKSTSNNIEPNNLHCMTQSTLTMLPQFMLAEA